VLLPFLYRRATKDGALLEHLRGWNLNFAIVALAGDLVLELTLYLAYPFEEKLAGAGPLESVIFAGLGVACLVFAALRGYYVLIGFKKSFQSHRAALRWLKEKMPSS
jgi:hypothetical protein